MQSYKNTTVGEHRTNGHYAEAVEDTSQAISLYPVYTEVYYTCVKDISSLGTQR